MFYQQRKSINEIFEKKPKTLGPINRRKRSKCNDSICDYIQLYGIIYYYVCNYLPTLTNFDHFVIMNYDYWFFIFPCE